MNETKWATIATCGNFGVRRWAEVRMSSGAVRGNCIWSSECGATAFGVPILTDIKIRFGNQFNVSFYYFKIITKIFKLFFNIKITIKIISLLYNFIIFFFYRLYHIYNNDIDRIIQGRLKNYIYQKVNFKK